MNVEKFAKIAKWMGWSLAPNILIDGERVAWWVNKTRGCIAPVATKASLTDAEVVEALQHLVERGYHPELYYSVDSEGFAAWYFTENPIDRALYFAGDTIHGAVEAALLCIIEREAGA